MANLVLRKLGILVVLVISFSAFAIAHFQVGSDEGLSSPSFLGTKGKIIGEKCENDDQCISKLGDLSQCDLTTTPTGTCECKPGAVGNMDGEPNTRCLVGGEVHIRERCEDTAQCVGRPGISSLCQKTGDCYCVEGYVSTKDFDDCLPIQNELGGPCTESQQCTEGQSGLYSECTAEGKCNCSSEGVSDGRRDVCNQRATYVGHICTVDSQCTANLELSHCTNGTCECWSGAVPNQYLTRCHLRKNLGESCDFDGECEYIEYAQCTQGSCKCEEGYATNPTPGMNNTCMRYAELIGERCGDHEDQCKFLVNATCDSGTCKCNATTHVESLDKKTCLLQMGSLGDLCTQSQQCQVSASICSGDKCSCDSGYVEGVENKNQCLQSKEHLYSCLEDIQCRDIGSSPGTVPCYRGACICEPPQLYSNGLCVTPRKLTQSCNSTEECVIGGNSNTWCTAKNGETEDPDNNKWCQCKGDNMTIANEACMPIKRVGDACENDIECLATIKGVATCQYLMDNGVLTRKCLCYTNYVPAEQGSRCVYNYNP